MKRHGCMLTYMLYIVIYVVYFILIGKFLYSRPLGIDSENLLVLSLFISFVLAAPTAIMIVNWKKILEIFKIK